MNTYVRSHLEFEPNLPYYDICLIQMTDGAGMKQNWDKTSNAAVDLSIDNLNFDIRLYNIYVEQLQKNLQNTVLQDRIIGKKRVAISVDGVGIPLKLFQVNLKLLVRLRDDLLQKRLDA